MEPLTLAALGIASYGLARAFARPKNGRARYPGPKPARVQGVAMATGKGRPFWPLLTERPTTVSYVDADGVVHGAGGRRFGADRKSGTRRRRHAGIDLYAQPGDVVVATERGRVSAILPFFHGAYAVYVCTPTGLTINYGEVERGSPRKLGVRVGDEVQAGQAIARIGRMSGGSSMLHFETYRGCHEHNYRWFRDEDPPKALRDPTDYLLRAAQRRRPTEVA